MKKLEMIATKKKQELKQNSKIEDLKSSNRYSTKSKITNVLSSHHYCSESRIKDTKLLTESSPDLIAPLTTDKTPQELSLI